MNRVMISILWVVILSLNCYSNTPLLDGSGEVCQKKVLIINSYRSEVDWSRTLTDSISSRLKVANSDVQIYTHTLNADALKTMGTIILRLRASLWSLSSNDYPHESLNIATSFFAAEVVPDILVIVGEEVFQLLQGITHSMRAWRNIPIVLCGVNDSISQTRWTPGFNLNYDNMLPIECKLEVGSSVSEEFLIRSNIPRGELHNPSFEIVNGKMTVSWNTKFNLTGVKMRMNLDRNIELIRQLHPDLKEIVWVDNNYYRSNYAWHQLNSRKDSLLKGVVLSRIVSNVLNADSIYSDMLMPNPGRVYLTHSWKIEGIYSRYFESTIDSLFTHQSTVPFYSLSQQTMSNNYYVGGYYPDLNECSDKSARLIQRILNGEKASQIPFDSITQYNTILNESALKRYELDAAGVEKVIFHNHPLSFYDKYERSIYYTVICVIVALGLIYFWVRHKHFCKIMFTGSKRYMRLYDKIQSIYHHALIDFAVYNHLGVCIMMVVDGKKVRIEDSINSLLPLNIFANGYFSESEIKLLRIGKKITKVNADKDTYEILAKPIEADNGLPKYMVLIIDLRQIMAERREREIYEQMFNFVSDFAKLGVATYNTESNQFTATEAWYDNLNEPLVKGARPSYASVIEIDRAALCQYFHRVNVDETAPPFKRDIRVVDRYGSPHWVKQNIFVKKEANRCDIIELNLNIDEQKANENKLHQAKKMADLSNREITEFLESMSHEIRTPLNSMVGFSSIFTLSSKEDREEFVPVIKHNQKLLNELTNNIICLSKIDSGDVVFKHDLVVLDVMISDILTSSDYDSERHRIHLNFDKKLCRDIRVIADEQYLRIVISNLLSNAIKFSPSGDIVIGCSCTSIPSGSYIDIYVKDSGCGIETRYHEKIFNRFYKLDTYKQGTGLGLSLCRAIVERMGGTISVISDIACGSTFKVKLKAKTDS